MREKFISRSIIKRDIEAMRGIFARGDIYCGGYIFSFNHRVESASLHARTLPFSRSYWAAMPPLKKWRKAILSGISWDKMRTLPTKEEAEKICAWDGWYWLTRVHLEMFFGLRSVMAPSKEHV